MSDLEHHDPESAPDDAIGATPPQAPAASLAPVKLSEPKVPAPIVPAPKAATTPVKKAPESKDALSKFKNKNADDEARMGFIDHLMELRKRLWISIIAVVVCVLAAVFFYEEVYHFLTAGIIQINDKYKMPEYKTLVENASVHFGDPVIQLISTEPLSSMIMVMWLGFWGGLVVASPIVLYELWAFVAPGLHDHEKRAIKPVLYGGVLFFLTGAFLAYRYLGPMTMDFFVWLDLKLKLKPMYTSEKYVDLMLTMMIVSGLLCEIPLIVAALSRLGVIEPAWLIQYWRVLTFTSIAVGMIVSPGADIASMSAFSGLILGIYLVSIIMAYIFYKKPYVPGDDDPKAAGKKA